MFLLLLLQPINLSSSNLCHNFLFWALWHQFYPTCSLMSSSYLTCGLPVLGFDVLGCHFNTLLVPLFVSCLAILPAHDHLRLYMLDYSSCSYLLPNGFVSNLVSQTYTQYDPFHCSLRFSELSESIWQKPPNKCLSFPNSKQVRQ